MTARDGRVPLGIKLAYGLGAAAYGIKENGYTVFLLLFYNQVIGLPASAVGTVIGMALVFDAMIDPVLGVMSDRTNTRWGRRHPWLYASVLPIAITWMLLWHPPHGTQTQVLAYLGVVSILARAAIATNEVPSLAMAPELTLDYHQRTEIMRYRYLFGWLGGMLMFILVYAVFLTPPVGAQSGPGALAGYGAYGIFGATLMAATVLISALGTHRRLAHSPAKPIARQPVGTIVREMRQTLSNRAFLTLMVAGVCVYTMGGFGLAVSQYNLTYVWQFQTWELQIYAASLIVGIVAVFAVVGRIGRAFGKIKGVILCTLLGAGFVASSYVLRLMGLMPPIGSRELLVVFLLLNTIGTAFGIGGNIIAASMMSDVVEAAEEQTGRREEGLFFAGILFMQKSASGVGIFLAGFVLQLAEFPIGVVAGRVPVAALDRYTLLFVLVTLTLAVIGCIVVARFPFGEAEHEARLAKLAVRSGN